MDTKQLNRIESVHRGFLYQHLFAVACLMNLRKREEGAIRVEGDEDVEIILDGEITFVQVKTRSKPLIFSDVKGALKRFDELRTHYLNEMPSKKLRFVFLSNQQAGTDLNDRYTASDWPDDVSLISPEDESLGNSLLPPAWKSLNEAISWCIQAAEDIPFRTIHPLTLVWKLASCMQYAATGQDPSRQNHIFTYEDLPSLFEQFVEQLQDFPTIPDDYLPQIDEPDFHTSERVRLIVGFSGAGKSVWASWQAQHCSAPTVYFDVGNLPGNVLISSLSRELVARFLGSGQLGAAQLPAVDNLDLLRALNKRVASLPTNPIVILDNSHRVNAEHIRDITSTCQNIHFIMLAQPWPEKSLLETYLNVRSEELRGFDEEAIASVFMKLGAPVSPEAASKWKAVTAGMPLYVKNAAALTVNIANGDAVHFVRQVEMGEHPVELAQEILLRLTLESLTDEESAIVAALSMSSVPLSADEIDEYLGALPLPVRHKPSVLRSLQRKGIVQLFANNFRKIHDALRLPAAELRYRFSRDEVLVLQTCLRNLINPAREKAQTLTRFGAWLRLLPPTGEIETLIDLATSEYFHEFGEPSDLKQILQAVADADDTEASLKFWALDALVFWEFQESESKRIPAYRLDMMEELIKQAGLGEREQTNLLMKKMVFAGRKRDLRGVNELFERANLAFQMDAKLTRIMRYNYAIALFHCKAYKQAHAIAETLYVDYYDLLELEPSDVFGANAPDIIDMLSGDPADHQDNMKHLADSLNMAAMCLRAQGLPPRFTAIHAAKFYTASNSFRSAMKAAQDVADDFVATSDFIGARQALENLVFPVLKIVNFTSHVLDVRSQYAVILAYCGQIQSARDEMAKLEPYIETATSDQQKGFANQQRLIESIAQSKQREYSRPVRQIPKVTGKKVGRNDACPCGSGKKYKKCCLNA